MENLKWDLFSNIFCFLIKYIQDTQTGSPSKLFPNDGKLSGNKISQMIEQNIRIPLYPNFLPWDINKLLIGLFHFSIFYTLSVIATQILLIKPFNTYFCKTSNKCIEIWTYIFPHRTTQLSSAKIIIVISLHIITKHIYKNQATKTKTAHNAKTSLYSVHDGINTN